MSLFGLSPAVFWLGAGVLTAGLLALHLLRVRLRRVEVDTLLFFRLAGALQKPRVLPGRPARWLAFALALLALLAAWLAVAAPRSGLDERSRFVVVEPDLLDSGPRLEHVRQLVGNGLGPRGTVVVATTPPTLLLAAHEPIDAIGARAMALRTLASPLGEVDAVRAAADLCRTGDEVLWVGAMPPASGPPVVHVPVASSPAVALRSLRWQREGNGELSLLVRCDGAGTNAAVQNGTQALARGSVSAGIGELRLGPFTLPVGVETVSCVLEGANEPLAVPVPTAAPVRVFVEPTVPAPLGEALAALLEADAELTNAASPVVADVIVATADAVDDPRPRLVLTPGVGDGPRHAVATGESPVLLSLRDQTRRSAGTLGAMPEARVWIADAVGGGALVAATAVAQRLRIHVVDWLLQPVSHADVPALLSSALRALGRRPDVLLAIAGQPLAVPAAFPDELWAGAVLPVDGALPLQFGRPGTHTLTDRATPVHVVAAQWSAQPLSTPAVTLAAIGGDGAWTPWLILLLVVLLAVDALLFHRGRLP